MPLTSPTGDYIWKVFLVLSMNNVPWKQEASSLKSRGVVYCCSFLLHNSLCTSPAPNSTHSRNTKNIHWSALFRSGPVVAHLQPGSLGVTASPSPSCPSFCFGRCLTWTHGPAFSTWLQPSLPVCTACSSHTCTWNFLFKICLHDFSFRNFLPFFLFAQVYTRSGSTEIPLRVKKTLEVVNAVAVFSKY